MYPCVNRQIEREKGASHGERYFRSIWKNVKAGNKIF